MTLSASYFLMDSDIKGTVHNPGYYFNQSNPRRLYDLDLLLLTQGWRDFLWKKLPEVKTPTKYMQEKSINISGSVRALFGGKPKANSDVSMVLMNKGKSILLNDKTKANGRFSFNDIVFKGISVMMINAQNEKGKEILTKGWRVAFETEESKIKKEMNEKLTLPSFVKGEKGPHEPSFLEKETKPPRNFTEASLLRAMETAGKQVDDDEMRELMKENGIGRPSTRASIIETLFRRKYIERKKKLVLPTQTGIDLINIIDNELLKSAELTGRWEKRLKEIERGDFNAGTFIKNMKKMVDDLVYEVRSNKTKKRISSNTTVIASKTKQSVSSKAKTKKQVAGKTCPKCKKGQLLKGSSAYGCSEYKNNCDLKLPFEIYGKKVSENQIIRLIDKGCTTNLKGFKTESGKVEGLIRFDESFALKLEPKVIANEMKQSTNNNEITSSQTPRNDGEKIICPKCKKTYTKYNPKVRGRISSCYALFFCVLIFCRLNIRGTILLATHDCKEKEYNSTFCEFHMSFSFR